MLVTLGLVWVVYMRTVISALLLATLALAPCTSFGDSAQAHEAVEAGDYESAMKLYRQIAEQGDAKAQATLGALYSVAQDHKQAAKWYRLAAEQGIALAQQTLGDQYTYSLGVPQDYKEALKWYRLAAEQGNDEAQFMVGMM